MSEVSRTLPAAAATCRVEQFDQVGQAGERLTEADPFIGFRERDGIDGIPIFFGPEYQATRQAR